MHTDVQREGGSGRSVAGCCIVSGGSENFFFFKWGGGPVCVTKRAPREVEGAKATAGLPQRVTRCCWTCFLESNYIRAPESHCKHE